MVEGAAVVRREHGGSRLLTHESPMPKKSNWTLYLLFGWWIDGLVWLAKQLTPKK
jgi:hypothetical protein